MDSKTVTTNSKRNTEKGKNKKPCRDCDKESDFTITPIFDNGVTYIREEPYHLCKSCFKELIKTTCYNCQSDNIIKDPNLGVRYCDDCGTVVGKTRNKSYQEKRDYKTNKPELILPPII